MGYATNACSYATNACSYATNACSYATNTDASVHAANATNATELICLEWFTQLAYYSRSVQSRNPTLASIVWAYQNSVIRLSLSEVTIFSYLLWSHDYNKLLYFICL